MPTTDSTTRLAIAAATTVVMMLLVWLTAPAMTAWHRTQLAEQLAEQVAASHDSAVKVPLRQLANLGDHALEPLIVAAASQREAVSAIARQIIDEKLAAWEMIAEASTSRLRDTDCIASTLKLAATLAVHIEEFGPAGKQWAERLALAMIARAPTVPAGRSGSLLEDCSRILTAVPPQGPKLRTVTALGEVSAARGLLEQATAQPQLESLTRVSEGSLEILARRQPGTSPLSLPNTTGLPGTTLKFERQLTPVPPPDIDASAMPAESASSKLDWTPPLGDTLPKQTTSQPVGTAFEPTAEGTTGEAVIARPEPVSRRAIDIPTPREMQQRTAALQQLPSKDLLVQLARASFFEAGSVRAVLRERGFDDAELALLRRLNSPDAAQRLRLVDEVSILPAASALRFLRLLLDDANADVRLRALTALATTNAPNLAALARELAIRDEDPRVSELASRLLRPTR